MIDDRPTIGIAGLTHLGINTGAAYADIGFPTVWYSPDATVAEDISSGKLPVSEPGLDQCFEKNRGKIHVTGDLSELEECDVVYIASDVPTDDSGQSDLSGIRALIASVAPALGPSATLVILCQVPPGFTREITFPQERLIYQVETLIFGRALERARHPERYIVGQSDPSVPLPEPYRKLLEAFDCPILTMRYESAELAKIAINCCLVAMVSTANTLAELCEGIGADWSEIVPALRLDRRIGPYSYLKPGLGISGGNLERDLATVVRLAGRVESDASVVKSWIGNSAHRKGWAYRTLSEVLYADMPAAKLGVLGLAYKEDTHSTKNAPSLELLNRLNGKQVSVYDPVVKGSIVPEAHDAGTALEACDGADAIAIMTPWADFKDLSPAEIAARMRGDIVLDPYGVLDAAEATAAGLKLHTLGTKMLA